MNRRESQSQNSNKHRQTKKNKINNNSWYFKNFVLLLTEFYTLLTRKVFHKFVTFATTFVLNLFKNLCMSEFFFNFVAFMLAALKTR